MYSHSYSSRSPSSRHGTAVQPDLAHFIVEVDSKRASIQTLRSPANTYSTDFVLNSAQAPDFDGEDSRFPGDVVFHGRLEAEDPSGTMTSGMSRDIRSTSSLDDCITIIYTGNASSANEIQGFSVQERYALSGPTRDSLDWIIQATNDSPSSLIFEDFGVPLLMNSRWGNGRTHNYEQSVHSHSFVARYGSYIYRQRPNGEEPMLVMIGHTNTALEFNHRFRDGEGVFGESLPKWQGLSEYNIHYAHIAKSRPDVACQYLPATALTLSPGES